ncbi:phenylalanine--tRNA ligase subunit beta, partial [candidate division KSB1 bacterium]|nr:phenylalanine--tRNA ligase subunit beta [candidate division KSB1 bacterium]
MRVLLSWLKEFVDISLSPADLAEALTMIGLEVESVEQVRRDFTGVVVGKVITCEGHPSAEKLHICRVEAGGRHYSVVCGAPNVAAGMHAPLALPS